MTLRSVFPRVPFALILLALGAFSVPARADVHLVQVNEYYTQCDNGSTAVQYIELKPFVLNQFFRLCASIEIRRTSAGPLLFFAKPVFVGHADDEVFPTQKTFLLATASFQTLTGVTPDLVIPDGILDPAGGVIRFAADSGCSTNWGTVDLVAYGDQGADPAPGLHQAANLTGFGGAFTLGAPSPKNFAGVTSSTWTCVVSPNCSVQPTTIDFDTLLVGSTKDTTFTIKNTGGGTLSGTASESCPDYSIISGGGPYSLAAGESLLVTVRFDPLSAGVSLCTIETGDALCSDVDVSGASVVATGVNPIPSYTFSLDQNHPNPFNPRTRIGYSVDREARVVLAIYDVSGKRVRTLVDRQIGAGQYAEEWDGRDNDGGALTSGVYFYRLTVGNRTLTRKTVLLK